jgi:hypothetical protein
MLRNRKIKQNWNNEDITLLVWLVSRRIELLSLSHFSELVQTFLFSKSMIGSLYRPSSQAPPGRSASTAGLASKR